MTLLLFIWQFPQIVVGYIVKLLFAGRIQRRIGNVRIYSWAWRSGVSFGYGSALFRRMHLSGCCHMNMGTRGRVSTLVPCILSLSEFLHLFGHVYMA